MNELTTIDVPELKFIEQSKAAQIASAFSSMSTSLGEYEQRYNELIAESSNGITEDLTKKAKRLRLDIGKIRIDTGKIKDKQKEDIKLLDRAIMGVHNFLVLAVKEKEDKLCEIEKHFERIQQEKRDALQREREELISEYIEDAATRDLAGMDDLVWEAFFTTCKRNHEEKLAAEAKAVAERIEKERQHRTAQERSKILRPYYIVLNDEDLIDIGAMEESKFYDLLELAKQKKADYDAEQKRIREENERLQREKEEAEKKAAAERAKAEAERKAAEEKARKEREEIERKAAEERRIAEEKAKKEREEHEKKLAAERAERERIAKELQDKKDAEEKARKEKEEAERKAARAPDKDKIASFIKAIESLPVPEVKTVEGKKLAQYIYNQLSALVTTLKQQNEKM